MKISNTTKEPLSELPEEITLILINSNGNCGALNPQQKVIYYNWFCKNVGLEPASLPFQFLKDKTGREKLYCDRGGCAQLNKLYCVSHTDLGRKFEGNVLCVYMRASLPDGRHEDSLGAVNTKNLDGEMLSNAFMRAETKAKRRSTLDLLGLGMLDEEEVESLNGVVRLDNFQLPEVVKKKVEEKNASLEKDNVKAELPVETPVKEEVKKEEPKKTEEELKESLIKNLKQFLNESGVPEKYVIDKCKNGNLCDEISKVEEMSKELLESLNTKQWLTRILKGWKRDSEAWKLENKNYEN